MFKFKKKTLVHKMIMYLIHTMIVSIRLKSFLTLVKKKQPIEKHFQISYT
jgi:hypothetical protein